MLLVYDALVDSVFVHSKELHCTRAIYVVDGNHASHFLDVFAAGRALGWLENGKVLEHVSFGLVVDVECVCQCVLFRLFRSCLVECVEFLST